VAVVPAGLYTEENLNVVGISGRKANKEVHVFPVGVLDRPRSAVEL